MLTKPICPPFFRREYTARIQNIKGEPRPSAENHPGKPGLALDNQNPLAKRFFLGAGGQTGLVGSVVGWGFTAGSYSGGGCSF